MSSWVYILNKKDILILGKGPTSGLDDTMLIVKKKYSIKFTEQQRKFCLSLHYKGGIVIYFLMMLKHEG